MRKNNAKLQHLPLLGALNQFILTPFEKTPDRRPLSRGRVLTRGCDPWGYLSPPPEPLPHPFNTANHQINVRRYNPPPRKTNYLSILYCQDPSTLCLCRLQLVQESIKKLGVALVVWGGTIAESGRGGISGKLLLKIKTCKKCKEEARRQGLKLWPNNL